MKKIIALIIALICPFFLLFLFFSCSNNEDNAININDLSINTRKFISYYFPDQEIVSIKKEKGNYEIFLNYYKLIYDEEGNWDRVQGYDEEIPEKFLKILPQKISYYISLNHINSIVTEVKKLSEGYQLQLNDNLFLIFDNQGNFLYEQENKSINKI